ncbi:MAG: hypothetical protein SPL73_05705 [Cyanobacteriota bacterium]|nr:hypothetical protein [Cyanobacteriota bacterium]MDY6364367.1 hypothetical protein [Cyanobacteriota bacterium]
MDNSENNEQNFDNPQNSEHEQNFGNNENHNTSDFTIPEEYQDKGWVRFFDGKTGDELRDEFFKSYDNSQTLIGKRVEDYLEDVNLKSLSNYEKIKENLAKQIEPQVAVPQSAQDYNLNDILKDENGNPEYEYPKDTLDYFGEKFKDLGLTKEQGQQILKSYTQFEVEQFRKNTNADDLEKDLKSMFNESGEKSPERKTVESLLTEFLPQEDKKMLQETAPNNIIEMFYKVAKGLTDKYGYKESSTGGNNSSSFRMSETDKNNQYNDIVSKLEELDSRPHTDKEKNVLLNQLKELYK